MISVCMASFNGSKYIEEQLESILIQLGPLDEVVIVDDASKDDTVSIVKNFNDPRIKLIENDLNVGVISSFEKSLCLAVGDFIFLSDQDDIWLPDKVSKIMELFCRNSEVTLCLSDASIIDDTGKVNAKTYFDQRGSFKHSVLSNILKNKFLGCSLAFKKSMITHIIPIPNKIPAHDMWIGLINEIYGKSAFVNKPLFQYRRHSENVSSMTHENIKKMVSWRITLIFYLSLRLLRILIFSKNK